MTGARRSRAHCCLRCTRRSRARFRSTSPRGICGSGSSPSALAVYRSALSVDCPGPRSTRWGQDEGRSDKWGRSVDGHGTPRGHRGRSDGRENGRADGAPSDGRPSASKSWVRLGARLCVLGEPPRGGRKAGPESASTSSDSDGIWPHRHHKTPRSQILASSGADGAELRRNPSLVRPGSHRILNDPPSDFRPISPTPLAGTQ